MLKDEILEVIYSRYKPTKIRMHSSAYCKLTQELGAWTALDSAFAAMHQKLYGLDLEITDTIEEFEIE